ncbi:MAG: radical SAM protein [bacterium]
MLSDLINLDTLIARAHERAELPPPTLAFNHLDVLWLQVTGTLCNLACLHCFISCGPKNDSHPFMTLDQVEAALTEAGQMGVKEVYFTGGEPFMHPEIRAMIERTLEVAPLSILTNGILIDDETAAWLGQTFAKSRYNLDLRVSLDGTTAEENDAIRGRKTFEQIVGAIVRLWEHGVNPVVTVTTCHTELSDPAGRNRFIDLLKSRGITQPRLKFLSPFKIGREERRDEGYKNYERLVEGDLLEGEEDDLQCSSCRMVTAKGVFPCPILIEVEEARMGDSLKDAAVPIKLDHPACYTCHVEGVTCRT